MRHPVILALRLNAAERALVEYWLHGVEVIREPNLQQPGELTRGCNVKWNASSEDVKAALDWQVPVLVACGSEVPLAERNEWFQAGLAALWEPVLRQDVCVLPPRELPTVRGSLFVVSDDENHRRRLRQLLRFCGYDLRADFRSAEEMVETLQQLHLGGGPEQAFPELLVLDLDSHRVDVPAFFHKLRTLRREHPGVVKRTRVLVTKDFSRPGADVRTLATNLRAFARRIYHPLEAVFVFLEGLVYRDEKPPSHYRSPPFRPTAEILFGESGRFPVAAPLQTLDKLSAESSRFARALLFFGLHAFLETAAREGALLAPQPDVDAGNLLDSIRRPNSTGVGVQNTSE